VERAGAPLAATIIPQRVVKSSNDRMPGFVSAMYSRMVDCARAAAIEWAMTLITDARTLV
jgi:hypothetical protein